jgi:signal transduction histidine kinase
VFRSLRSRLFLSYAAIIIACLLVAGLALLAALRIRQTQQRLSLQRLNDLAQVTSIALRAKDIDPAQTERVLRRLDEARKVRVLFLDARGNIVSDSRGAWAGRNLLDAARFKRDSEGDLQGAFSDPAAPPLQAGETWLFVARPTPDAAPYAMIVFAVLQPRSAALSWARDHLLVPLVWSGLVALVLSMLLALVLGRSVAKPLSRVTAAAEAISEGERSIRPPISGPSEVQALARSFNSMADQVEAAQQSQRDLVTNVSHELKTPLTSIHGFSQAILDGTAAEGAGLARAASIIQEEAERMRRMVDELLILARFDAGQITLRHEPLELGALLRACAEKLAPQAEETGVALEVAAPEPVVVAGDADQLAQVFANLVDNALAHTVSGDRVTLEAHIVTGLATEMSGGTGTAKRGAGQVAEVTVTDSGAGIPPEVLPRVFERFYRADKARRRRGGAGLGLAIAKEIVAAHSGTITVESVMGLGSKFTVQLPLAEEVGAP